MCRICFAHEPEISITFGRKSKEKKKNILSTYVLSKDCYSLLDIPT